MYLLGRLGGVMQTRCAGSLPEPNLGKTQKFHASLGGKATSQLQKACVCGLTASPCCSYRYPQLGKSAGGLTK